MNWWQDCTYCPRIACLKIKCNKLTKIFSLANCPWEKIFKIRILLSRPCRVGRIPPKSGLFDTLHTYTISITFNLSRLRRPSPENRPPYHQAMLHSFPWLFYTYKATFVCYPIQHFCLRLKPSQKFLDTGLIRNLTLTPQTNVAFFSFIVFTWKATLVLGDGGKRYDCPTSLSKI